MPSAQPRAAFLAEPLLPNDLPAAKAAGLQQMRKLHYAQRTQLLCAAAASGSEVNLRFALALLKPSVFPEVLQGRRTPDPYENEDDVVNFPDSGVAAVRAGHLQSLGLLLHHCPGLVCRQAALEEAAKCCDLPGLQAAWEVLTSRHDNSSSNADSSSASCSEDSNRSFYDDMPYLGQGVLDAAAESATPDAVAKMQWILVDGDSNGCYAAPSTAAAAARFGDLDRLRWLREQRCCVTDSEVLESALQHADLAVAQWLVDEAGCELPGKGGGGGKEWYPLMEAAAKGQDGVAKLRWLEERGAPPLQQADQDTDEAGDWVPADADAMHAPEHRTASQPQPQPQPPPVQSRPTAATVTQFYGSNPQPPRHGSTSKFRSTSTPKPVHPSRTSKQQPTAPTVGLAGGAASARGTAAFRVSGTSGPGVGAAAGKGLGEGPFAAKSPSAVPPTAHGPSKVVSSHKGATGITLAAFGPQGMASNHRGRRAVALAAKGPGGVAPGATGRSGVAPATDGPGGVGLGGGVAAAAKGLSAVGTAAKGAGVMAAAGKATGGVEAPASTGTGGVAAAARGSGVGAAAAKGPAGAAPAALGTGRVVVTALGMDVITQGRPPGPAWGATAAGNRWQSCLPVRQAEDDSLVLRLVLAAATAGQMETVRHLLSVWGQDEVPESMAQRFGDAAAASGSIPMARYLRRMGAVFTDSAYTAGAHQEEEGASRHEGGCGSCGKGLDVEMIRWLAQKARVGVPWARRLGAIIRAWAQQVDPVTASQDLVEAVRVVVEGRLLTCQRGSRDAKDVLDTVARFGDLALVQYLHGVLGCAPDGNTLQEAVMGGCEEVVEWLVREHPACQECSRPYACAAKNGDLGTLTALARLRVPWGRRDTVAKAVQMGCTLPALQWLVKHGARAGSKQGLVSAKYAAKHKPDVLALLQKLEEGKARAGKGRGGAGSWTGGVA